MGVAVSEARAARADADHCREMAGKLRELARYTRSPGMRRELVAEVKYLTWTCDNLLRQVVYKGLREDKPAAEVRREAPHPKPVAATTLAVNSSKRRRR